MQRKRRLILFVTAFTVSFGFLTIVAPLFAASKERVVYSFNGASGSNPSAGLLLGAAGNLYGTLYWGGSVSDCGFTGCGTVFEVLHAPSDQWTAKVLYRFHNDGFDGKEPFAGLISDAAGNLYGTTLDGGPVSCSNQLGCGTVFKLTRHANGKWTKKQLHNFGKGTDGSSPFGGLIFDAAGNLYGTTFSGGTYGLGTVFQLRRCRNGKWIEKVLYSFKGEDGNGPRAGLISDTAGNLYGTTGYGGSGTACGGYGCGTVFQLKRGAKGIWIEKVLHSFKGEDGSSPYAGLTFDAEGNLYGTTAGGGDATFCQGFTGCGVVFQLVCGTNGVWTEKVLHIFRDNGTDGTTPVAGVISGAAGNLYGTTEFGGSDHVGAVFQLTLDADGKWTEKLLHTFIGTLGEDGLNPTASLIFDSAGNLYGTTAGGGAYGYGAIFEITQ